MQDEEKDEKLSEIAKHSDAQKDPNYIEIMDNQIGPHDSFSHKLRDSRKGNIYIKIIHRNWCY